MNPLEKYAAKKLLIEKLATISKEAKIPGWAKPFVESHGGTLKIIKWPESETLKAKLKMLQAGRGTASSFRPRGTKKSWREISEGGPVWKHRKGKPDAGWPKGSLMDSLRAVTGRQ